MACESFKIQGDLDIDLRVHHLVRPFHSDEDDCYCMEKLVL